MLVDAVNGDDVGVLHLPEAPGFTDETRAIFGDEMRLEQLEGEACVEFGVVGEEDFGKRSFADASFQDEAAPVSRFGSVCTIDLPRRLRTDPLQFEILRLRFLASASGERTGGRLRSPKIAGLVGSLWMGHGRRFPFDPGGGLPKGETSKRPLSVIVLDLDQFKSINDTFGHAVGDFVLKETVKVAQSVIRSDDFIGRFGGDEFMAVLWDTSLTNACIVAERIRSKIEKHAFINEEKRIPITVSLGVASLDDSIQSIDDFFKRADCAQYNAKKNGGNQVSAL